MEHTFVQRTGSAAFYGVSSLLILLANKIVLTTYGFPSFMFMACCQFIATILLLGCLHMLGYIRIDPFSSKVVKHVGPISVFFFINVLAGISGTKALSIPMFTAIRRFSILFTMLGEMYFLKFKPDRKVVVTVTMMIGGAFIAAFTDFSFDTYAYVIITINNLATAGAGVYTKMASLHDQVSKLSLLFYNSLFSLGFLLPLLLFHPTKPPQVLLQEVTSFPYWSDTGFVVMFLLTCFLGGMISYSVLLCTSYNSALTTTVIGCIKNVLSSYLGMFWIGGDYHFSFLNFVGLNISIIGSLVYAYYSFQSRKKPAAGDSEDKSGEREKVGSSSSLHKEEVGSVVLHGGGYMQEDEESNPRGMKSL